MKLTPIVVSADPLSLEAPRLFGWFLGAVWVLCLGFPVAAVITSEKSTATQVGGIAAIVLYGLAYLVTFAFAQAAELSGQRLGLWWGFAVMVTLALGSIAFLGGWAVSLSPFLVAIAAFCMPPRAAVGLVVAVFAGSLFVADRYSLLGQSSYLIFIMVLIASMGVVVRLMDRASVAHEQRIRELELVSERERVARDVHDVLGHSLTIVSVKTELARRLIDSDPRRAKAELDEVQQLARTSLAEVRATVAGLRVARLDEELESAATALAAAGMRAEVPDDIAEVDPRHRLVLAWALREGVTNVLRHAGASVCTITLGSNSLRVVDDGLGSPMLAAGGGLRGLRERVADAGGTVLVTSDERGTSLEVTL